MIFLYVQDMAGERSRYRVETLEDMADIFKLYPKTRKIMMNADTMEHGLQKVAEYLSSHHMQSWIESATLEKGLKEKAAALGLSLATAITPTILSHQTPEFKPQPVQVEAEQKQPETDFGTHHMDRFLWNVKQIESSGGKNTSHKPVKYGRFKGEVAIGKWGLLKPTVDEIVNRMRIKGQLTPEYERLASMDRKYLDSYLKNNPQVELNLARFLADHVVSRQKGDKHRAAYAWLNGHNLFPSDISEDHINNSDYVRKYKKYDAKNPFKPKRTVAQSDFKKNEFDFKTEFNQWYTKRIEQKTKDPMRDITFVPDPGRIRDSKLDEIKPYSQKTDIEKLKSNIDKVNRK